MKGLIKVVLGGVGGGLLGYLYYYFIGCKSGSCPITSNPYISTLWGILLGAILLFPTKRKRQDDN
ncbi:MAG: hypothetical protein CH6_2791 [Candidatus Kapaibacterium sp.]|jgi:uncharacterized membrane-anchored protein|nr:MAG: hypothetical protein CH6_2791 [Candidatus Kapabacteria bacterium]ROL57023.1 MAG: hypothetical protein D9V84_06255 [Bacteroidetes/Chlorobi group bacterium Naka2016]